MSEKDKKDVNDVNVVNDKSQDIPMPPPNAPAPVPKLTVVEPKNIGNKSDWEKNWKTQKGGSGCTWKVSKTYTNYKDALIEYLQTTINPKTTVGEKRRAARFFLQLSNRVTSQFEAIAKKQPLAGVSVSVNVATKNLDIAKGAIKALNSDIETLKGQIASCEKYAKATSMESLSSNNKIARSKSFGRGWLPQNHQNETLYQIEQGKSSGAGGKTKDKYKLDILGVLDINPDSDPALFEGFDAKTITLGQLPTFFTQRQAQLSDLLTKTQNELVKAEETKTIREKELFVATEDIKLARKQLSGDYNSRVRKAFRLGNEVLEGNLFNLLISDSWSPLNGQDFSEYSKVKTVSAFGKMLGSALRKASGLLKATQEAVKNDSDKELTDAIAEGKDDVDDWQHLTKLWPGYVTLDKNLTRNYAVALLAQGSLDSQKLITSKINKNEKPEKIIFMFLDARANNAQSELKKITEAHELKEFLVANGLSPRKGPFLVETHKLTGKPVLSPTVIKIGKLGPKIVQDINDRLGLTSIEYENKAAKSKKSDE
jgi:hypothetical protein